MSALSTKGPWSATSDGFIAAPSDQMNGGYYVAQVYGPDAAENIKIIAAAPALLAALKTLSAVYDGIYVKMSDGEMELCLHAWAEAEAAISKAGA